MLINEIILSDHEPFRVRQLGIFELDKITPEQIGPFTYTIKTMFDKEYEAVFDIHAFPEPPVKPDIPEWEIKEKTMAWYNLYDWQLYQAGILHEQKKRKAVAKYYEDVCHYILENCCLDDISRIVTEEDWNKLYEAALVPQLTMSLIKDTLRSTYRAEFQGQEVLEALQTTDKGHGSYNVIRMWENRLMLELKMTEVEYALLPIEERARKVCAMFLPDIMSVLEIDYDRKNSKKKNG